MSMGIYKSIYDNICDKGKIRLCEWLNDKDMKYHRHHINPKHNGGKDCDENYTYLTIREHYIAHWLLWKINDDINDLFASHLLQKKDITDAEIKKIWASKGGKVSGKKQAIENKGIHCSTTNPQLHREWASLGAKAHKGKKQMYKPGDKTFKRILPSDIQKHLELGYIFGSPIKTNKGKKFGPSSRRKKVTDGIKLYDSIHDAAKAEGITPSAIIHRLKSPSSNWAYFSDNES